MGFAKRYQNGGFTYPPLFSKQLKSEVFLKRICWGEANNHYHRLSYIWGTAEIAINELAIHPSDWSDDRNQFYNYFKKHKYSLDYVNKLVRVLNEAGKYYAKQTNTFYDVIPRPMGQASERIRDAFYERLPHGRASKPLTWELLRSNKAKFLIEHWNWLYLSLWFGLRPSEIDNLKWGLEQYKEHDVLAVYQHKLSNISGDRRWKFIPILFEEQKHGLQVLISDKFKRPLVKTLRRIFGDRFTTYAGRKGFVNLMWEHGGYSSDISYRWLGHKNKRTTVNHYTQNIQQACEF